MEAPSPIPAHILSEREVARREAVREMGRCATGCGNLDGVLEGGFERGCVVGVSGCEEGGGMMLALRVLSKEIIESRRDVLRPGNGNGKKRARRALVITPRPRGEILESLRGSLAAQMEAAAAAAAAAASGEEGGARAGEDGGEEDQRRRAPAMKDCLERIMLARVFDMEGLREVLSDVLLRAGTTATGTGTGRERGEEGRDSREDGADGDDQSHGGSSSSSSGPPPSLVLITHFSILLGGLFAQRESRAAYEVLGLVGRDLRRVSRGAASPLVMVLNEATAAAAAGDKPRVLFGVPFLRLVDLHLLCWRVARRRSGRGRAGTNAAGGSSATVVEVLADEMGVWHGGRGPRTGTDGRWAAVEGEA